MNCQSFAETISELARDRGNRIEATLHANVLGHLSECPECALRLQDQRALTRGLRELSSEMNSLTAPARVEDQLLATFRQTRQGSGVRGLRTDVSGRWALAVAAVLLVMLSVAGVRWYLRHLQPGSIESPNSVAVDYPKPSPLTTEVPPINPPAKPEKQVPVHIVRRGNPRQPAHSFNRDANNQAVAPATAPTANDRNSEVATYFMPLGYAGPINPQDGGQLVRVELPRSAMLSMGLPVNMDRYGERVKADVLLGPDGLARAIRFVQ